VLIDRTAEVVPVAADGDTGLIHSPADAQLDDLGVKYSYI
jgi:hypothetical protein